jgi:hypothetical protein
LRGAGHGELVHELRPPARQSGMIKLKVTAVGNAKLVVRPVLRKQDAALQGFRHRRRFGLNAGEQDGERTMSDDLLAFASEIQALLSIPSLKRIPNEREIYGYLVDACVDQDEETFFQGICRLMPG